jgi:peptidyl-prolyl cis-trans isomerase B (cyclophilin B)
MRRAPALILLALALAGAVAACGGSGDDEGTATTAGSTTCAAVDVPDARDDGGMKSPTTALAAGGAYRLVFTTNCGAFTVTLDQKTAPKTAASLVALAQAGFYDDTIFHRIVPGFVIQGGDPTQTGGGGPGYTTVDVPPATVKYTHGVVAMAKAANEAPGTSGSQFFVVTGADVGLPPEYAVVGKVTQGLDVVDKIGQLGDATEHPTEPVVVESVTVEES